MNDLCRRGHVYAEVGTYTDGGYRRCRACVLANRKKQRQRHPAYIKEYRQSARYRELVYGQIVRRKYGLSRDDYAALLKAQDGRCAICGNVPTERRLHVDHDHETGVARGLLCGPCNSGIGNLRDDLGLLIAATAYLQAWFPR